MRDDDELLRGHLLGKLDEEERSRLEERLIREEDLFETAEAVEADLLDDYAHDRLAPEERELVASRLASSPRGRSRLALIRGLGTIASEPTANVIPFNSPARKKLTRFERAVAMAAMLTFAVFGFWLARKNVDLVQPPQVAETATPVRPISTPAPAPPVATPQPSEEVIAESTPAEAPAPEPAAPLVIQLALSTVRGEEEIPTRNVPPGTERVQLHLQLDKGDKDYYASFQAAVRGPGWELPRRELEPREIDGTWTLVLDLDPKLPEGIYEVEVLGVTASGDEEPLFKELEITRNASAPAVTPD